MKDVKGIRRAATSLFMLTILHIPLAEATHEVDHRYLVLGYVRDGAGRPIPRSQVRAVREKTGFSYPVETDAEGFYLLVVHLHEEDLLDPLQVTAGRATIRVEARFNPLNTQSHRGTRIDFRGDEAQERQEIFGETLSDYLKR